MHKICVLLVRLRSVLERVLRECGAGLLLLQRECGEEVLQVEPEVTGAAGDNPGMRVRGYLLAGGFFHLLQVEEGSCLIFNLLYYIICSSSLSCIQYFKH